MGAVHALEVVEVLEPELMLKGHGPTALRAGTKIEGGHGSPSYSPSLRGLDDFNIRSLGVVNRENRAKILSKYFHENKTSLWRHNHLINILS